MARLSEWYGRLLDALVVAACVLLLLMTVMIGADVLSRNLGGGGVPVSNEISEDILYLMTLLAAPWLLRQGQHIRVDIILRTLPVRVAWLLEWLGDIVGLLCCLYFVWYGAAHYGGELSAPARSTSRRWSRRNGGRWRRFRSDSCCSRSNSSSACTGWPLPRSACGTTRSRRRESWKSLMSWQMASLLLLGGSTVLLFVGMPVAISFIAINLIGAFLFLGGDAGLHQVARNSVAAVINFSLTPIPLFILMGEVLFHTGLALKVIDGVERLIRQVPGRLAVVAVVAGTMFSAISGSTIATTAMLGSLMLPVMLSRGYSPSMATGPIMAIGAVDMLIPPSALTVLLGSLSGISISKLLIGGVVPGLMLSVAFVAYIVVRVHDAGRTLAPRDADREADRLGAATSCWCFTCCR